MDVALLDPHQTTPQRALIESRAALASAVNVLLQAAQRELLCMQHDLEPLGLASSASLEHLQRLLSGRRAARVRLLVDDARWLDTRAARLKQAQRQYAHLLALRVADRDDAVGEDSVVMADERHVLSFRIGKLVKGDLWLNHPMHTRTWRDVFERRWNNAGHDLPVAPLGL
jgi:hypothetical protein